jgi:hypothetical protein
MQGFEKRKKKKEKRKKYYIIILNYFTNYKLLDQFKNNLVMNVVAQIFSRI